MGLPITAGWKPWAPHYPARFSSCRLVATAGRWCPQPVNRHLAGKVGGAGPPGSSEAMSEMEKKNKTPKPLTTCTTQRREGKEDMSMSVPEISRFTQTGELRLSTLLCLSDRLWDFFSPPSQSLTTLSFGSRKRLWIILPVIATIEENTRKKELSSKQNVK